MRILVAGWIGSTNLGDELVFAGLRAKLAARGADVVAVSENPAGTEAIHGVRAITGRRPSELLAAAVQADAVVLGGGGLLQDETSPLNLPYHLVRVLVARLRHTPFAAVAVGAGRLDTRAGKALVARSLRGARFRGVSVRDADSAAVLSELGISDPVLAADLAFALDPVAVTPEDVVAVCLRPWTGAPGKVPAAARGSAVPDPFVDAAAAALDDLAATGLAVRFVAFQADRDDRVHRAVAARMRAAATFSTPGLDAIVGEVARARLVVAMRYHGGVAATLAGRPAVLIGYSPKVDALAGELGSGARLLPFDAAALGGLGAAGETVLRHADAVEAARDHLRARERRNDEVLDRLLDGS